MLVRSITKLVDLRVTYLRECVRSHAACTVVIRRIIRYIYTVASSRLYRRSGRTRVMLPCFTKSDEVRHPLYCTVPLACGWGKAQIQNVTLDEDSQRVARRPAENVAVRGCYAVAIVAILQPVPLSGYSLN